MKSKMPRVVQKISLRQIKETLQKDFPYLLVKKVQLKGAGKDNTIVEINGHYIFRFPKKDTYHLNTEINVLKFLNQKITLAIPCIKYIGKSAAYIGYPKIPGAALTSARFNRLSREEKYQVAKDLATFIFEIHQSINLRNAKRLGIQKKDISKLSLLTLDTISHMDVLKPFHGYAQMMLSRVSKKDIDKYSQTVLYNDLHEGNIAFDIKTKKVNGIFDFGDMKIGNVEHDFIDLCKISIELTNSVVQIYNELSEKNLDILRILAIAWITQVQCLLSIDIKADYAFYETVLKRITKWTRQMQKFFI